MIKKTTLLSVLLFCLAVIVSNAQVYTWPVSGKKAGDNILSTPQSYVGESFNFEALFVRCEAGDIIVCPVDGTLASWKPTYYHSLTNSMCWDDIHDSFDAWLETEELDKGINKQYISIAASIKTQDGITVHISGIIGDKRFKTGQKLHAGDTLGTAGRSYKEYNHPSLRISVSDGRKVSDPMTPFGLKTTFKEAKVTPREDPISVEKAREDLLQMQEAIIDAYPSLSEVMDETEYIARMDSLRATITRPLYLTGEFRAKIQQALHIVHDSHMGLLPDHGNAKPYQWMTPALYYVWYGDHIEVLTTTEQYKEHIGKTVVSINGVSARDHAEQIKRYVYTYDGHIESTLDEDIVLMYSLEEFLYMDDPRPAAGRTDHVEFSDGSSADFPYIRSYRFNGVLPNETVRRTNMWYSINKMRSADDYFHTEELNDSTSYLAIRSFAMQETDIDAIGDYLKNCTSPNLIIDVRNNGGGHADFTMKLLSYLTDKPLDKQKGGYEMVNHNGRYESFKNSFNYNDEMDMYTDYVEDGTGKFRKDSTNGIQPDSLINYTGRIYVLTNGSSYSASTLLPSVLVRNRRAVTVGRETGTAYHYMTAENFADIMLSNSQQTIHIPLVKSVFDTTVNARVPSGRGLMPDYPVELSKNEILMGEDGNTDVVLQYALSLIADGKYLSEEDPFAEAAEKPSAMKWLFIIIGAVLLSAVFAIYQRKRKHN